MTDNLISIGRMEMPTFAFGAHSHDHWEVSYYYFGCGTNTVGGVAYEFSPGTVICQPPHISHEERSEAGYKNYFFTVKNFVPSADRSSPLVFRDTSGSDLFNITRQLYYEWRIRGHEQIAAALTDAAVAYIAELGRSLAAKNPYVEQFEHTLAANISNPGFNITEAALKLPFSINHFRCIFTRETGVSPKRYLQRLRIEQAMSLLAGSSLSVGDVGRMCGFSDQYYFSRSFKEITGLPPSRYRAKQSE